MSQGWSGGSDTRWRTVRASALRLDLPDYMRPRCALGTPGVCVSQPRDVPADQVDHITPLAQGGDKYDLTNCRPACGPCNRARNAEQSRQEYQPQPRRVSSW